MLSKLLYHVSHVKKPIRSNRSLYLFHWHLRGIHTDFLSFSLCLQFFKPLSRTDLCLLHSALALLPLTCSHALLSLYYFCCSFNNKNVILPENSWLETCTTRKTSISITQRTFLRNPWLCLDTAYSPVSGPWSSTASIS